MRIMKRTLGIILAVLMAFSMMPLTAFAADAPQATVEEITAPAGIKRAFKFTASAEKPTDYDNYNADFEVYFNKSITAGEVTLWGKYGDYDWTPITINEDVAQGRTIRLVDKFLGQTLKYSEIRDNVSPFYCGISTSMDTSINAIVKFKLYQVNEATGEETGVSRSASETIGPLIPADPVPEATITEVTPAPQGIQRAFKFVAPEDKPTVYDNYDADFVVSFQKDIKAGEVILWGKYGNYDWTPLTINRDIARGESVRLVEEFLGQKLTYAEIRDNVGTFFCGITSHSDVAYNVAVELNLFPVNAAGQEEGEPLDAGDTHPYIPANPAPVATVTEVEAPEGAAFAYKYEAPATSSAIYDNYHADFVAKFDRNIKAGEVTLYGKYGDYGWTPIVIDRDIAAGEEFRIIQEFANDTLTYAEVRDTVSPFYCGAGGDVLADTNMSVELKLYPVANGNEGIPVSASDVVDDTIGEPLPQAIVNPIVGAPEGITAFSFAAPHDATEVDSSKYKDYRCDFVVTFDKDIAEGDVILCGQYGEYGWVDAPAQAFTANTEYRLLKDIYGDTLTYSTICKEVSPFLCGYKGAAAEETGMKVELRFYKVEGGVETEAGVSGEVETTVPQKEAAEDQFNIVLSDSIHLNVYIKADGVSKIAYKYNLDPSVQGDTTPETAVEKNAADLESVSISGVDYYHIEVPLAPAQIRDLITIDVYSGNQKLRTIETSIADYCEGLINAIDDGLIDLPGDEVPMYRDLAVATLDYGKAASALFDYNTAAFEDYVIENDALFFPDGDLQASDTSGIIDATCNVHYIATSVPELRFETNIALDNFFDNEGNANYTVTCTEGYDVQFATINESTVVIQVKGIPAGMLSTPIHLNISGDKDGTITYTPIVWAYGAATTATGALADLGLAIMYYSEAASRLL